MKSYYLDTSALVKGYVPEPGSRRIKRLLAQGRRDPTAVRLFVSHLAYPEAMSALMRRQNERRISAVEGRRLRRQIADEFTGPSRSFEIVEPRAVILDTAALLVIQHSLRGFDAVHLAAATYVRRLLAPRFDLVFLTADARLHLAATEAQIPTEKLQD